MIERECELPFGYLGEKGSRNAGKIRAIFLRTQNKETGFLQNLRATAKYFHKNPVSGHLSIRLL